MCNNVNKSMLYYFTSKKYALDNLSKNRVKVSDFSTLNDTFDIFTPASRDRSERAKAKSFVEAMGGLHAVLCMSATWENPLMWAHYADRHYGICIGFEVDITRFRKVNYIEKRLTIDHFGVASFDALVYPALIEMMSIKFNAWSYENEYRYFSSRRGLIKDGDHQFLSFSHWLKPKELILGQRCSISELERPEVGELQSHGIKLIQARSAFNSFKIVPNRKWVL